MRVGAEILARRLAWAVTPPRWRGTIALWHASFVDTATLPKPPLPVYVLDLGAYLGDFAMAAAQALRQRGNAGYLTLVEPVFTTGAQYAADIITRGRLHANVRAVAAGWAHGVAHLYVPERHRGLGATFYADHRDVRPDTRLVEVPVESIADLLLEHPQLDLVKVNIEGAELALEVVPDAVLRRTPQWLVEFHRHALPQHNERVRGERAVRKRFRELGYAETITHTYGPTVRYVRRP